MYTIYRGLLLVTYFSALIQCQGGGGSGGSSGGGGGSSSGSGSGTDSNASCTGSSCKIAGIVFGSIIGAILSIFVTMFCRRRCKGHPLQKNSTYIKLGFLNRLKHSSYEVNLFQSGSWSSQYFQYKRWYGPHQMSLNFDPQSMHITGSAMDDVGTFTTDGIYSTETRRIGLTKRYTSGTGNPSQNLGHAVTIQIKWNSKNKQFEGKWYVRTHKYHGENKFVLQHNPGQESFVNEKV